MWGRLGAVSRTESAPILRCDPLGGCLVSHFLWKSILSVFFAAAAVVATAAMLCLMGKAERRLPGKVLRRTHRTAGWIAVALLVIISYYCTKHVAAVGDQLSVRAVLHGTLALILIVVLALKVLIVRIFREFIRFVPAMGLIVFSLVFVVVSTSAGYFFVRTWCGPAGPEETQTAEVVAAGEAASGVALFQSHCAMCHDADSTDPRIGPGLAGLFGRESLRGGGRPVTPESVASQIVAPVGTMPSFESRLAEQEIAAVVEYLKTL